MKETVGLVSLGCSKNRVDSEQILGLLEQDGYTIVSDPAKAEIIIINTCGFIQSAKEESIDTIFEMAEYKKTGKCKLLIVTGCLTQRYPDAVMDEMPEVDAILGANQYDQLIKAIEAARENERPAYVDARTDFLECGRVLTTPSYSAYVKIGDGCDNRCSYCAIPLIRGGYRSRAMEEILREVRELVGRGVKEITLISQDTTRYGTDWGDHHSQLPELLEEVAAIPGVEWLRTLYCYPDRVDTRLLDTIERLPNVCKYLDLPIQHIDQQILRAMNRTGTEKHIRELAKDIRARGMMMRTTVMVGFPGETQEQFESLLEFVKEAQFDRLGGFAFSPEDDTTAAEMDGQIDEEIKEDRLDKVMTLQQKISLARNKTRVGTTVKVLCEGKQNGVYYGRSEFEAPETDGVIEFTSKYKVRPGEFVNVRIVKALEYDLIGEVV